MVKVWPRHVAYIIESRITKFLCLAEIYNLLSANRGFHGITSIYQPTNAHTISHNTLLKHFKTLRDVSILSDHHQGALFLAKVILQCSQFNSYLQTRCCGSISCCVGMCCGAVARCASYDAHLAHLADICNICTTAYGFRHLKC